MLRHIIFILLILGQFMIVRSQAVHYFHCLEVMEDDEVVLYWEAPGNQADFDSYQIYHRVPPAVFTEIANISNYSTTTYTHSTADAKLQSVEYFIVTTRPSGADDISDTLSTIHLTVDNSLSSLAVLDWNPVHDPLLSSSDYEIMSHDRSSTFSLVGTTPNLYFEMPVTACWDTLFFKIEITDVVTGCSSVSNIYSAEFRDVSPPAIPFIDSVSINPYTGEVILGWPESMVGDAGGYVVYHVMSNKNDTLDFIFGKENTSYLDDSFDPCSDFRSYALSAFDTCMNISPGSYDLPQRTILFDEVIFDPCEMTNSLNWSEYINMSPALEGYRVYMSLDGGDFTLLNTLASGTTSYVHQGLVPGHNYQYFIRAFSQGEQVTSSSCFRDITTYQYLQPTINELPNASVDDGASVTLTLWLETNAYVTQALIYRSEDPNSNFQLLDVLDLAGEAELYYDDIDADVNTISYYYETSVLDSCGNEVLLTDPVRSILLMGEQQGDINTLSWNAFEGWVSGVDGYEIYRATEQNAAYTLVGSVDYLTFEFDDDVSALGGDFSVLQYAVRAIEAGGNGFYSQSNVISFDYEPNIILPNAFAPNGYNSVYQPVGTFTEFSEYSFNIYNRWGQLIFTSNDFSEGWDGTINGSDAPTGVYVCNINYRSHAGESSNVQSTFVLIR